MYQSYIGRKLLGKCKHYSTIFYSYHKTVINNKSYNRYSTINNKINININVTYLKINNFVEVRNKNI